MTFEANLRTGGEGRKGIDGRGEMGIGGEKGGRPLMQTSGSAPGFTHARVTGAVLQSHRKRQSSPLVLFCLLDTKHSERFALSCLLFVVRRRAYVRCQVQVRSDSELILVARQLSSVHATRVHSP